MLYTRSIEKVSDRSATLQVGRYHKWCVRYPFSALWSKENVILQVGRIKQVKKGISELELQFPHNKQRALTQTIATLLTQF